jgi:hypothetical protein
LMYWSLTSSYPSLMMTLLTLVNAWDSCSRYVKLLVKQLGLHI